jgi:hypothetical protein
MIKNALRPDFSTRAAISQHGVVKASLLFCLSWRGFA